MKQLFLFPLFLFLPGLTGCGPNREKEAAPLAPSDTLIFKQSRLLTDSLEQSSFLHHAAVYSYLINEMSLLLYQRSTKDSLKTYYRHLQSFYLQLADSLQSYHPRESEKKKNRFSEAQLKKLQGLKQQTGSGLETAVLQQILHMQTALNAQFEAYAAKENSPLQAFAKRKSDSLKQQYLQTTSYLPSGLEKAGSPTRDF